MLDVKRVMDRQKMVEEARTLQKFVKKRDELDQDITREIEELKMMSENCEGDKSTIGMSNVLVISLLLNWIKEHRNIRIYSAISKLYS